MENKKDINMKCKICDNKKNNRKMIIKEWMINTHKKFSYFQCSKCGCIQILKIPKNLSEFYPQNYYSMSEKFSNEKGIKKKIKIKIFKSALKNGFFYNSVSFFTSFTKLNFFKYLKINKKSKILDVGCGKGSIIYYLNEVGYKKAIGIDSFLDKNKINYPNSTIIYKKKLEDLNEKFDLIILNHSFEHMENSLEVLKKISKLLNKKGYLVINIPIADSYAYKKYKEKWFQLDAPRHFFIHTKKSMMILAKKVDLKIKKIKYNSNGRQFLISKFNKKKVNFIEFENKNIINKIIVSFLLIYYNFLSQYLNYKKIGDQAIFIIKK